MSPVYRSVYILIDFFPLVNQSFFTGSQLRPQKGRGRIIFPLLHSQALQKMSNQFPDMIINGEQLSLLFHLKSGIYGSDMRINIYINQSLINLSK